MNGAKKILAAVERDAAHHVLTATSKRTTTPEHTE